MRDQVSAWVVDSRSHHGRELASLVSCLDEEERERSRRLLFEANRVTFDLAHVLARHALSTFDPGVAPEEWRFTAAGPGRPELAAPFDQSGLRFNISHTRDVVACVVTRHIDCGVDVEVHAFRRNTLGLARKCLAPLELRAFSEGARGDQSIEFLRYWTLKEAHAKAIGQGLHLDFRTIEFDLRDVHGPGPSWRPTLRRGDAWHQWQWRHGNEHEVAICVRRDVDEARPAMLHASTALSAIPPVMRRPTETTAEDLARTRRRAGERSSLPSGPPPPA